MRSSIPAARCLATGVVMGFALVIHGNVALAQGCAPSRFTSVLGREGDVYLSQTSWRLGVGYGYYHSDEFIVGHSVRNDLAPNGKPSIVTSRSIFASLTYAVSDRVSLTLGVPFLSGNHETNYADGQRHQNTAVGLGEISLSASESARATGSWASHLFHVESTCLIRPSRSSTGKSTNRGRRSGLGE